MDGNNQHPLTPLLRRHAIGPQTMARPSFRGMIAGVV
jgi:hypothetical protein